MNIKFFATSIAALLTTSMAATVNTGLWFDGTDAVVKVTKEEPRESFWTDYDDRALEKGGSYMVYPFDPTEYNGSFIEPMIQKLGYVAVAYVLKDPRATGQDAQFPYNYAGIRFYTINSNYDPLDISPADGLCVTYTSNMDVALEVYTSDAGDASCFVTLPGTTTPATVEKGITDFKQPDWAKYMDLELPNGCADAFAAAKVIKFKLDGNAEEHQGFLRIFEVGPKGTCQGNKSIGNEPAYAYKSDAKGSFSEVLEESEQLKDSLAVQGMPAFIMAAGEIKATLSGRTLSFSGTKGAVSYAVANVQGQTVKNGKAEHSVNLADLEAGIYMVRISNNGMVTNQKILLK